MNNNDINEKIITENKAADMRISASARGLIESLILPRVGEKVPKTTAK